MQTVAETPSSLILAPQPPRSGPKLPMKNSEVRSLMPWNEDARRSAWWPAITRSGMAGARALKIVSPMGIVYVIHPRIAAGPPARITRPRGAMGFDRRDQASFIGV